MIMEYKTVRCPDCSREIQVSSNLETAICYYCGSRFGIAVEIAPKTDAAAADLNYAAYYDRALMELNLSLTVPMDISATLKRESYSDNFYLYYGRLKRSLDDFNKAYELYDGDNNELVRGYAEEFGHRILENAGKMEAGRKWEDKFESYIYLYVAFAVPGILKYEKAYSEAMADTLLSTWNTRYPKRKLHKAGFEQINAGFYRK
jgi:DNA-directed RNA polymerase subunit RPC12/RpoP